MLILDAGGWIVDAIGKLGPLAVAIAVFITGKRQSSWLNSAAVRSASLEDQKFRLALLDRRLKVIEHLRLARSSVASPDATAALGAVLDALREADLVFEDRQRDRLNECLTAIVSYQSRFMGRFADLSPDELREATMLYVACNTRIAVVHEELRNATRVTEVPALTPPS